MLLIPAAVETRFPLGHWSFHLASVAQLQPGVGALSAEQAQAALLTPTRCWQLQETDGTSQGLARLYLVHLCVLYRSFFASVPYAQFKLGGFRSVSSLELSGTIQSL